jgi:hypothetical protein
MREKSIVPDPKCLGTDPDGFADPCHCITDPGPTFFLCSFTNAEKIRYVFSKFFGVLLFLATYNYTGL